MVSAWQLLYRQAIREVIEEVITRLVPAHDTIAKELLAITQLFASLAFDKNDVENQEWINRRFAVLQDIFRDTPAYQYIAEEAREEERQARLQDLQKILLDTVQARFPRLEEQTKAQLALIKDVTVLSNLARSISTARTQKEARHYLYNLEAGQSE